MNRHVVVIGGGISGLAAAWELTGGAAGPDASNPEVTVLEASDRLGGSLRSGSVGDRVVDLGPDGFLGRRPEAAELCREIGLGDALVPVGARGAGVWARGRVRPLPDGLTLGVPVRAWPTVRSGIVGWRGTLALGRDVLLPRPDRRGPIGDRAIGPMLSRKLGQRVVDLLADPMIGGIHAGSVDDMSAAAIYPALLAAAQRRGSLMKALRSETTPVPADNPPPLFWALDGGLQHMADRLGSALAERGVTIRPSSVVHSLERSGPDWSVSLDDEQGHHHLEATGVVLAVPAPQAAELVRPHDQEMGGLLAAIDYASVLLVTLRLPPDALGPRRGTGFLVPRRVRRPGTDEGWMVTACTYLTDKWPHLSRQGDVVIRASIGRYGDNRAEGWSDHDVVIGVLDELEALIGLTGAPLSTQVTRFPQAFPQYRVHHLMRTAGIEAAAARLGGLAVAGSAYRGVGIPACIASGRAAARLVR
ncbi:MAG TPA: protoporphyrinogen oxidase [Acidimicrobiales bacterium]